MSVQVLDLSRNGPAYTAGLRVGDRIYMIGGRDVGTAADIPAALAYCDANADTAVRVRRGPAGSRRTFQLRGVGRKANGKLGRLGIVTEQAQVGKFFKGRSVVGGWVAPAPAPAPRPAPAPAAAGPAGVAVLRVAADSVLNGVQPGDILLTINGRALNRSEDVASAVKAADAGLTSTLTLVRQGQRLTRTARFGRRPAGGKLQRLGIVTRPEAL